MGLFLVVVASLLLFFLMLPLLLVLPLNSLLPESAPPWVTFHADRLVFSARCEESCTTSWLSRYRKDTSSLVR